MQYAFRQIKLVQACDTIKCGSGFSMVHPKTHAKNIIFSFGNHSSYYIFKWLNRRKKQHEMDFEALSYFVCVCV